jgi:16S rRNA (cytosine1402-N4)-methyltransferase
MVDTVKKYHIPALRDEVLQYLDLKPGQTIVDATAGTAGHSEAILARIGAEGVLVDIDRDEESLAQARERLSGLPGKTHFVHGNFCDLDTMLNELQIDKIDGILFDLGISSFQLMNPERGFSFQEEGPLDMRLDRESYISAYDLINNLNEDEISSLLWSFGQERWHNRIAHRLVQARERQPISTTAELREIVMQSIPRQFRRHHYRIHPATRTFQAVRIAVNRELEVLETALCKAVNVLRPGGRICVISFHSLEDRIVKHRFRAWAGEGLIEVLTRKPIQPTDEESALNPSSRSSKLRAAQKCVPGSPDAQRG